MRKRDNERAREREIERERESQREIMKNRIHRNSLIVYKSILYKHRYYHYDMREGRLK